MLHLLLALHLFTAPHQRPGDLTSTYLAATPGIIRLYEAPADSIGGIGQGENPVRETAIDFPGLGKGLSHLIGQATGVLGTIAIGFFGLLLGIACLGYAWNHNNPRKLQESRTAIIRILEAAALFGLIGVILGLVDAVVGLASGGMK